MLKGFKEIISCIRCGSCLKFYTVQTLWLLLGRRLRNIPMLLVLALLFILMALPADKVLGAPYLFWHDSWAIFLMSLSAVGILLEEWTYVAILLDTDENNPINNQDPPHSIGLISAVKCYVQTRDGKCVQTQNDPLEEDESSTETSSQSTDRSTDIEVFKTVRQIHTVGTYSLIFVFSVTAAIVYQYCNERLLTSGVWGGVGIVGALVYSAIPLTAAYLMFWLRRGILKISGHLSEFCEVIHGWMKRIWLGWLGDWIFSESIKKNKSFREFHVIALSKNFLTVAFMLIMTISYWLQISTGLIPSVGLIVCVVLAATVGIYGWMIYQRRRLRYEAVMAVLILFALVFVALRKNVPKQVRLGSVEIPKDPVAALEQVKAQALLQKFERKKWIAKFNGSEPAPDPEEAKQPENAAASDATSNLTEEEVLQNWLTKASLQDTEKSDKPILVLVSNTGGGIKAQVWSTIVLNAIEQNMALPDDSGRSVNFSRHVRLISGASGGMVGAGYWAATLAESPSTDPNSGRVNFHIDKDSSTDQNQAKPITADHMLFQMSRDCLSDLARQGFYNDLLGFPLRLVGIKLPTRGEALEDALIRYGPAFNKSFRQLKSSEDAGWLPSLVYTPTVASDGRRLLISNQPLEYVFYSRLDQFSGKKARDVPPSPREDRDSVAIYSWGLNYKEHSLPDAKAETTQISKTKHLKLATAARLSGNFPVVVDSPFLPFENRKNRMQIMDAGYIDNHGLFSLASWIEANHLWIKQNTSGLLLVEISAATLPRLEHRSQDDIDNGTSPPSNSSPPELFGFVNSSFNKTLFHSDRILSICSEQLNTTSDPNFFKVMAFEYDGDASLSWYLSNVEKLSLIYRFLSDGQAAKLAKEGVSTEFADKTINAGAIPPNLFLLEHAGLNQDLSRGAVRFGQTEFEASELARKNMGQNLKDLKDWWQERSDGN